MSEEKYDLSSRELDKDFNQEFQELFKDQEKKMAKEEQIRKALRGFEVLIWEKKIFDTTGIKALIRIVREKTDELKQSIFDLNNAVSSQAKEELSADFQKITQEAKERLEILKKTLNYLEAVAAELKEINETNTDWNLSFDEIHVRLENRLNAINQDEAQKRGKADK